MGEFFAGRKLFDTNRNFFEMSDLILDYNNPQCVLNYYVNGHRITCCTPKRNTLRNYFRCAARKHGKTYEEVARPYLAAFPHMFLLCSHGMVALYVPNPKGEGFLRSSGAGAAECVERLITKRFRFLSIQGNSLNGHVLKYEVGKVHQNTLHDDLNWSSEDSDGGWFDSDFDPTD